MLDCNAGTVRGIRHLLAAFIIAVVPATAIAASWTTYRHDNARSGVTDEQLNPPFVECWAFRPQHAPAPAWRKPNPRPVGGWYGLQEMPRVHFDDAFRVAAANDVIYFGSSADGKVYALDAKTGRERWSIFTGGPVRLAPTLYKSHLYVGSDDGFVYCLRADDGSQKWKFRAAPGERQLLGSGKMISMWPVRTGVIVDRGVAYFGAGIFPAEGVYMYAVDAEDGKLIWCNDTCGAAPQSRISPQGYLLASESSLFAPLGRVSPAVFDRKDGRLRDQAYIEHVIGGTFATLADGKLFTGTQELIGYDQASHRSRSAWFWGHRLIATEQLFYVATGRELFAVDRQTYPAASLRRKSLLESKRNLIRSLNSAKRSRSQQQAEFKKLRQAKADQKRLDAAGQAVKRATEQTDKLQAQTDTLNGKIAKAEAEMAAGEKWRIPSDCAETLVLAGDVLLAGGSGKVVAVNAISGQMLWTGRIDGKARGLAVADGRVIVSSTTGTIYCYGAKGSPVAGPVKQADEPAFRTDELDSVYQSAAEHIIQATGVKRGYCLVLGCGTGRLIFELVKRTDLQFCAVEADPDKAQAARQALDKAGLYGARVLIVDGNLAHVPFSDYFANLIVSEEALVSGQLPSSATEALRLLKPQGGMLCLGQPNEAKGKVKPLSASALQDWLSDAGIAGGQVTQQGGLWLTFRRGPLPGAGCWTHQYANTGNTACSDDELVRCPLGLLWFGDPGPTQMADRHRRAAAPLACNGRFFVLGEGEANRIGAGENSIMAYDAYNGVKLWERKIRGALRVSVTHDAGNSAVNDDSLFVAVGAECLRLNAATGKTMRIYKVPPAADGKPRRWGYVGVVGDLLYGARTARPRTADCVFAVELSTGRVRWKQEVEGIAQGSIAIGDGRLFFASDDVTDQQRRQALAEMEITAADKQLTASAAHLVIAVDAATGQKIWEKPVEFTGVSSGAYWCSVGAIYSHDVLVVFGVFLDGHYWKQFFAGQFESRRVVALSGKDGHSLWQKHIGYRVRPVVVGDTLHAEPWAFELQTGKQKTRVNPITGREEIWQFARPGHHCGCPAAAPHALLFRSLTLAWYDLVDDFGTQHFGGQRPGCWINFIPANGLLIVPEASSGCMCAFPNACTVVFQPREENRQWAYFSQPGPLTPVKRLALNLGAPGDRKDPAGGLWLGYPRPGGSLVMPLKVGLAFYPGWRYFGNDPARLTISNTDKPWVFLNGVRGLRQCTLPLMEPADGTARYTVRLAFAELDHETVGERLFDIKIQGKLVAKNVDILREAGARNRALVKSFPDIDAVETITVELVSKVAKPEPDQLPILQGIEVEREQMLTLGLAVPSFLLDNAKPEQTADVVVANYKDEEFTGTLQVDAPDGFTVTPVTTSLKVAAGQKKAITLKAAVVKRGPVHKYAIGVRLLRADGSQECRREAEFDYLGNRTRVVVQAIEDTFAMQSTPTQNRGGDASLNVDGGDRAMRDHHHSIAYLKFPLELEGKPVSVVLRLYNAGNPTGDSGQVRLVTEPWNEKTVTYQTRPKLGDVLAKIGPVTEHQVLEIPLQVSLEGRKELSLAIDPTGTDGVNYLSREGGKPAELIIECAN